MRHYVTVVSGLPRTGTSMMMQMLESGGLPLLVDGVRTPDEDNPRGYYEFEAVKKTREDSSWLKFARGKAVKMVYCLLYDLPGDIAYRVILMNRRLSEVYLSQEKMLKRNGRSSGMNLAEFEALFSNELNRTKRFFQQNRNFRVLNLDYSEIIAAPQGPVRAIDELLGGDLVLEAMERVVEQSLYRQRT